jgi:hypothetical protein
MSGWTDIRFLQSLYNQMAEQLPYDLLSHIFIEGEKDDQAERYEPSVRTQNRPEFRDLITVSKLSVALSLQYIS